MSTDSSDPPPPQAKTCTAYIDVENKSSHLFKFQVLHQYTGDDVDDSGWHLMKPNEKKYVMKVNYRVGIFTTGTDNWKVHGKKVVEKTENGEKKLVDGEDWRSGTGVAVDWKKHTLRSEDNEATTTIKVFETEVQFDSPSGVSTTSFYRHDKS
ncbi:hypothetical protein B9Z55_002932 [Caenorhabditis nigoni]|uniref:Up-regulated in Daf-2 domain-containing protein n=1 Tax=Caenorhabditis nigoni TaxID=1611254 RepID=A0A2G5VMR8_9PELO|nr:hypothetical protein B9Z55_002932 [Caenorhabditis nigoni]